MTIIDLINIVGTIAFTISGYLVGFRKHLDLLGVIIVSLLTAVGGGMIRDILINEIPFVFRHNTLLISIIATLFVAWLFRLQHKNRSVLAVLFIVADAIGLVAFSITGAQIGLEYHLNLFGVITLAFVTAVGGGIVRDILVNDLPIILRQDIYGSIAIVIAAILYVCNQWHILNTFIMNVLLISGVTFRVWAYHIGLSLPRFRHKP